MAGIASLISQHIQSDISRLSVAAAFPTTGATQAPANSAKAAAPTPTPSPSPKQTPTSTSTKHNGKTATHASTTKTSASRTPSSAASKGGGISGGAVAAIVIVLLAIAAAVGFFVWRWRKKRANDTTRNNLWKSGPSYAGFGKVEEGLLPAAAPTPYVFSDMSAQSNSGGTLRPISTAVPTPPPKETDTSPVPSYAPGIYANHDVGAGPETKLMPPSPAHSPRPRTNEISPDPYATVQAALGQHQRNDSGPLLLYSTPTTDRDYGFGGSDRPGSPGGRSVKTFSTLPNPHRQSYSDAPPMPIPVPTPVPVPASSSSPSPHASVASGTAHTTPRLTLTPTKTGLMNMSMPEPSPGPPAYTSAPEGSVGGDVRNVIRTYVPSLLDELQVSVGEKVRVVNEYDDGWAYCEKIGDPDGAAGVVPVECLDASGSATKSSHSMAASLSPSGDTQRFSARFSSFHVDFDAIHAGRHD